MKEIRGGIDANRCKCSCYLAGQEGSSSTANCGANAYIGAGSYSSQGDNSTTCVWTTGG